MTLGGFPKQDTKRTAKDEKAQDRDLENNMGIPR